MSTCSCNPCSIIILFVYFLALPSLLHSTNYLIDFYTCHKLWWGTLFHPFAHVHRVKARLYNRGGENRTCSILHWNSKCKVTWPSAHIIMQYKFNAHVCMRYTPRTWSTQHFEHWRTILSLLFYYILLVKARHSYNTNAIYICSVEAIHIKGKTVALYTYHTVLHVKPQCSIFPITEKSTVENGK